MIPAVSGYNSEIKLAFNFRNPNIIHTERFIYNSIQGVGWRETQTINILTNEVIETVNYNGKFDFGSVNESMVYAVDTNNWLKGLMYYDVKKDKSISSHINKYKLVENAKLHTFDSDKNYQYIIYEYAIQDYFRNTFFLNFRPTISANTNLLNQNIKIMYYRYEKTDSLQTGSSFNKHLLFYTLDNGSSWSYFGEFKFNYRNQVIQFISINKRNNEVYICIKNNKSPSNSILYKSKYTLLSTPKERNESNLLVYFSSNSLTIENEEEPKEITIKIFDLGGRAILQKDILLQKGTNQIPLSSHINPNLYLVNIELTNSKINIYKLIKGE